MITYSAFIESDTDITNLGFSTKGDFYPYYCTPKNARILGFAGTDGIHFCTVEKFGETVFAVSPMNFGNCVHPIAKNFEDFLRLLLSVADTAVLEQCCLWTKEQYDSFVSEFPATGDQTESLNILQNKFGIEPLGNPFEYVKELQAKFDYSAIPYTDDYFDSDMNPSLCKAEEMRNVYFEKGFWQKKNKGRPCSKIDVNKSFVREEKNWYVPAVYSCAKGFVVDFCIEVPSEAVKDFNARWIPVCESDNSISPETEEQVERENPLNADFTPSLILNGKEIKASQGSSLYWMSADCIPNGTENTRESEGIVKNYCLDTSKAWSVHRWSFPYPKANKAKIKKLNVNITQPPRNIKGICFSNPKPGSTVSFTHPLTNTDHEFTGIFHPRTVR